MYEDINLLKLLDSLKKQADCLKDQVNLGIIDSDGAALELEMITKKEKALKEQFVCSKHITNDGNKRTITHHLPTSGNPKDYYITKMADGSKIKACSYDKLIEKLFCFYSDGLYDFTIDTIFEVALREKAVTENPKQNTLDRIKSDYKRYINKDFSSLDIRFISDKDLKRFLQDYVSKHHPKETSFLALKGILNIIFDYAYSHKLISENPLAYIKNKVYLKSCDTYHASPEEKILSPAEIKILQDEVRYRMTTKRWGAYYINGYAMLFAIETGVRVGELCALRWSDIKEDSIHIHAQQLSTVKKGGKHYYYDACTKNEKGISQDGRYFPLTEKIKSLLSEIKDHQTRLNIKSDFIFCHEDGEWIKTDAYLTFLRRLCQSKGFSVTNNHALRMSLNSNVFIPMGISVADRAALLGHSIETNLKYYSFASKDYLTNARNILNSCQKDDENDEEIIEGTPGNPSNIIFLSNKKALNPSKFKAF